MIAVEPCPSADVLAGFLEGSLDGKHTAQIEQHVDRCPCCGEVIAAFARALDSEPMPSTGS